MPELPEINDRKSFEAWLKPCPVEVSIIIAHRAAMTKKWARDRDLTSLPVLRQLLALGVATKYPTREVRATSVFAGDSASSAASESAAALRSSTDQTWHTIETDCHRLIPGADPFAEPLWHENDNPLAGEWAASLPVLRETPGGEFWIDWYQRALDGRPQNWPMLRDIALIEDAIWKQGGGALDQRITEIRMNYAIAVTPNGEKIEQHPETGLLQLVSDTELPDHLEAYIRRKIITTVEIFDDPPAGNQYSGLQPDLDMLRTAAERTDNSPVDLFDACKSALRRLETRIKSGDCPSAEKDTIIGDYKGRLLDTVADIVGNDTETQNVLDSRKKLIGNNTLVEERKKVLAGVEALTPITTEYLAEALPEDAELATSPDAPADASYRLVSRVLRIGKLVLQAAGPIAVKIRDILVEKAIESAIMGLIAA